MFILGAGLQNTGSAKTKLELGVHVISFSLLGFLLLHSTKAMITRAISIAATTTATAIIVLVLPGVGGSGVTGISQFNPVNSSGQSHSCPCPGWFLHSPSFSHGLLAQLSISVNTIYKTH